MRHIERAHHIEQVIALVRVRDDQFVKAVGELEAAGIDEVVVGALVLPGLRQ